MSQHISSETENFAQRVRELRRRSGLTQAEWAELGGVSLGAQHRYEAGATEPNASYFAKLDRRGIDILLLIAGRPSADALDGRTQLLLAAFFALPPNMQDAVVTSTTAIKKALLEQCQITD
ncbi:helix-turn-helix domain-containing protein [Sphingomonas sp. UYP23]